MEASGNRPNILEILRNKGVQQELAFRVIDELRGETGTSESFEPLLQSYTRLSHLKREGVLTDPQKEELMGVFAQIEDAFGPWTSPVLTAWRIRAKARVAYRMDQQDAAGEDNV